MSLFTRYPNAEAAVIKLLKNLSISIAPETIAAELEKHPDYPSLLAISDVLTSFRIENGAFRVETGQVTDVPRPFIANTDINNGDFVVVNEIKGDHVVVSSDKWNKHKLSVAEFKTMFGGVVLTAERLSPVSAPGKSSTILTRFKFPLAATGLLLILISALVYHSAYFEHLNWQTLLLTAFKTAGLATSVLLLIQSIDSNNPLVQKLCQSGGKTNCNAILSSKAAKVFEGLTWSEVGFFYFAGTWLVLLFGNGSAPLMQALAILNFISLPYTCYSIYYQARVAKQWCVLCCTVQALLWLEFVPLGIFIRSSNLSFREAWGVALSTLFIALLSPVILWVLLKPLFLKVQQLQPLKQQLQKFKYNTGLFNHLLKKQPKYAQPDESWSIVLGNVEANNSITMVTNPYCPPCAKTHKLLDELLDQHGNLQARIVFTASNNENDFKTPVSRHLMALNDLPDKTIIKKALHDWYEQKQKSYEAWAKAYPVSLNEADFYKLDFQKTWCQIIEVTATPTILLNGHRLPDSYQLPDLKYMLE
ncbi:MAG: vitamin K epoxide reductase family protein [Mucilaginibacter sp.]